MSDQTVNATFTNSETKEKTSASISYDFGATVAESVELFGEEVVLSNFTKSAVILAQGVIRRSVGSGLSEAQIQERFTTWKVGVAAQRVAQDPMVAAAASFAGKTPEEQAAYVKELQAIAKGNQG